MRAALVQLDRLFPPVHGGARANRLLIEELAHRGWDCRVLAAIASNDRGGEARASMFQDEAGLAALPLFKSQSGLVKFECRGVSYEMADLSRRPFLPYMRVALTRFQPDAVLVSDSGGVLAAELLAGIEQSCPNRLVYLPKTANLLPCGPYSAFPDPKAAAIIARAKSIVANSRFVAGILESELSRAISYAYFPVYESASPRQNSSGCVTLINACNWKGLPILLALASLRPRIPFAAVQSWGTTHSDLEEIRSHSNITLIPFSDRMSDIYAQTRVLLAPSLWHEAFGQVVIQAMLRGIPVLAADIGGLPEAKLGVPYLIPVRPIEFGSGDTTYAVPEQDPTQWLRCLDEVWGKADVYRGVSAMSRVAAERFISTLSWDDVIGSID